MRWYNPKTRSVEDASVPFTDEESTKRLRGHLTSEAFLTVSTGCELRGWL